MAYNELVCGQSAKLLDQALIKKFNLTEKELVDRAGRAVFEVISNTTLEYCLLLNNFAAFISKCWIELEFIGKFRQAYSSNLIRISYNRLNV